MLELPGDITVAFSHLASIGLASILEDAGVETVALSWTGSLDARAIVAAPGIDWDRAARIVHDHAAAHAPDSNWTAATVAGPGGPAGLLSPRIKPPADDDGWLLLTKARRAVIDEQVRRSQWLDLALIGALGEPAYWRFDDARGSRSANQLDRRPDEGASRWEMKTRNRGEDFVAHRLRKLAISVAARGLDAVRDGLAGASVVDEAGSDAVDSRTATGLAGPGPVDNALAWCALWGISAFPVIPLIRRPSRTAGHLPRGRAVSGRRDDSFYLPVPARAIGLARYRQIALSDQLATVSLAAVDDQTGTLGAEAARAWLVARHVGAIVRFPIGIFGSASAPERRALLGIVDRLGR
jgi:CRISPR-associated protein Csb3